MNNPCKDLPSPDPKLKSTTVVFKFATTTGSRSEAKYSTSNVRPDGSKPTPEEVITEVVDELARVAAIDGYGDKVVAAAQAACKRVEEWNKKNGRA